MRKEEVELSIFADDIFLQISNHKESTKNLLELINKLIKIEECIINLQKSIVFLSTGNEQTKNDIN